MVTHIKANDDYALQSIKWLLSNFIRPMRWVIITNNINMQNLCALTGCPT